MSNPLRPYRSVRVNGPGPLGMILARAPKVQGVARRTLSRELNWRAAISPE